MYWMITSRRSARARLGVRATRRSSVTASPVTSSATVLPLGWNPPGRTGGGGFAADCHRRHDQACPPCPPGRYARTVDVDAFVAAHHADWDRLERLINR